MKIIVTSDTHNLHESCTPPPGRIFIHAGDMTGYGDLEEVVAFNEWLGTLDYEHRIVIAGNHDFFFEKYPDRARSVLSNATYLMDESIEIDGIKIYGSPWQPFFCDWAFNLHRGEPLREKWAMIPDDTDILVTHGPPFGHGDELPGPGHVGCEELLARIMEVRPRVHIFGHIHEGYGITYEGPTMCLNASCADANYKFANDPFEVEVPD
jgi:Icc-related predicted phosphoesterase